MSNQDHLDSKCPNVHSANAWETVDLGSPDRNEKFLRLMGGATSREHKGSIIIGECADLPHRQIGSSQTKIAGELESQFREGVDRRAMFNEHQGLGSLSKSNNSSSPSPESSDKSSLRGQYLSSFVPAQRPHP
ncbi:Small acidic protein [Paragonimus heterotremus]|uniref:Small acidic protein n=1 Tax=Paragonimus heterotremus TaxID=100268 RepID=A0A8J4WGI3_9TREM|nr:Small acidic protein [Paragonimus heterotremus]